jgi:signal transduction histidine kinase/ActR/RegA family two-component response regulator
MMLQPDSLPRQRSKEHERNMRNELSRRVLRIALLYALVAAVWMPVSDWLLTALPFAPDTVSRLAAYKGWAFVTVTALSLYFVLLVRLRRETEALRQAQTALREKMDNSRLAWRLGGVASFEYDILADQFRTCPPIQEMDSGNGAITGFAEIMKRILPEDRPAVQEALKRADSPAGDNLFEFEHRAKRTDGSVCWIRTQGQTFFEGVGAERRAVRLVGTMMDISEHKRLEEQFLHAQRMEAIGTLASGVAHDLNNILAPMLMGAGLLKSRLNDADDQKMLALIEHSAQRGASIVRQLLSFGRGVESIRGPLQLRRLLEELGSFVEETFPRSITIVVDAPADLWTVQADATQLYQVLMNLCVNARDAMPDGGKLTVEARNVELTGKEGPSNPEGKAGSYVVLAVSDTGRGIPPEIVHRIFEPFFTTKGPGKGTGLGLSTALGIVKSHGGFMTVASEPGRGSNFKVHLSAEKGAAEAVAKGTESPLPAGRGELILVVDDEVPIQETARLLLEEHHYRVLVAANGAEAIQLFIKHRQNVRLMLTDVMMPVMDGATLIRSLRVLDPKLKVKVIAMSGLSQEDRRAELVAMGVTNMLTKPFGQKELLQAVGRVLSVAG